MTVKTQVQQAPTLNGHTYDYGLFSTFKAPITAKNVPIATSNLLKLAKWIADPPEDFKKLAKELTTTYDEYFYTGNKEALKRYAEYKKYKLPYACFSGVLSYRSDKNVVSESGLICLDLDCQKEIPNKYHKRCRPNWKLLKKDLIADKELEPLLIFHSPSNNGLRVVINANPMEQKRDDWLSDIEDHFYENYKIGIAENKKDANGQILRDKHNNFITPMSSSITLDLKASKAISAACFLCYDETIYINPSIV